ncbi:Putative cytochrome P450 [Septoria linicola]|uniref:Cytochrome P450 n=1 Tax=Septoria linicola TaxID=215465 RepID=A0A9Q9ENB6_9PEZI|nr:Putative cytochrome P450 [Septoria linicola]
MDSIEVSVSRASKLWLAAAVALGIYVVLSILTSTFSTQARFWRTQPWAGQQKGWFKKLRSGLRSIRGTRDMLSEAYWKHSKENRAFVMPQFAQEPTVMLPQSMIKDFLQEPEENINLLVVLQEVMAIKYTGDADISTNPFHLDIVKNQLTRKLPLLTSEVHAELVLGFDDQWRVTEDEWTAIPAIKTCSTIISRAANRVFSGAKLCREPEWLEHTRIYGQSIFMEAGILTMLPWFIRPIAAPFICRNNAKHVRICQKHAVPVIEERFRATREGTSKEIPNDALQWIVEKAIEIGDSVEMDPKRITRRLMRLNMVAIHTTSITITNALLDLYSSSKVEDFVAGLREECERVLKQNNGQWNKTAVNELYRIDSTIKESMRVSSLGITGLMRKVTKPDGINLPDGTHIPQGVRIAAPNVAIHQDPEFYDRPDEYDAFRFSRSRELHDSNGKLLEARNQAIVTTNESFLPFGHGRHACPGRFFASQEMKLMLAHIVMNYDVKIDGPRPKNVEIKGAAFPSGKAKLLVRKRKVQAES